MISQTLEWYRFGDVRPEMGKDCMVLRDDQPLKCLLSSHLEKVGLTIIYWVGWDGYYVPDDNDLWAYWEKPKEGE